MQLFGRMEVVLPGLVSIQGIGTNSHFRTRVLWWVICVCIESKKTEDLGLSVQTHCDKGTVVPMPRSIKDLCMGINSAISAPPFPKRSVEEATGF